MLQNAGEVAMIRWDANPKMNEESTELGGPLSGQAHMANMWKEGGLD
jgi:hypothetical protein